MMRSDLEKHLAMEKHLPKVREDINDLLAEERTKDDLERRQPLAQEELQESIRRQAAAAARRQQLAQALQETQDRFLMLKSASARCPVCGDELSEEKRCALGH